MRGCSLTCFQVHDKKSRVTEITERVENGVSFINYLLSTKLNLIPLLLDLILSS